MSKQKVFNKQPLSTKIGGLLFVLPSIITVIVFVYGMIAWSFNMSLTNKNSVTQRKQKYVGFKNYTDLIHDERFTHALST